MKQIEYIYSDKKNIHVIQAKVSQNSKIGIGYVIQTYHFSIDQVINNDFKLDKNNCLNCPYSFNQNNGKSGGCYTHKGTQSWGLKSMLKRLHNNLDSIKPFNSDMLTAFYINVVNTYKVDLIRFGAYGEAVLMGEDVINILLPLSKKHTGYTHQWDNKKYTWSKNAFMSSTHNLKEVIKAEKKGFRNFFATTDKEVTSGTNCPASKESGLNLTCIKCGLCSGTKTNIKKDIFILNH
jgi:hypothetical protein